MMIFGGGGRVSIYGVYFQVMVFVLQEEPATGVMAGGGGSYQASVGDHEAHPQGLSQEKRQSYAQTTQTLGL